MINRAAIILKYREPAVVRINEADPYGEGLGVDLETVNEERTIYLISDDDADCCHPQGPIAPGPLNRGFGVPEKTPIWGTILGLYPRAL